MRTVLILGGRAPVALDHARRFAHQGWRVLIGDSVSCRLSGFSRAVSETIVLKPPRFDPAGFVADLCRAIEAYSIELVIPTCEEVFFLSRYRAALPASCRIFVDDFDKLRRLHSKWDFLALAQECGGNPPPSATVLDLGEARAWAGQRPLVLKPEYSRFGVNVRLYPEGIPAAAAELPERGRWVAQSFCSGKELCSYSIADKGRLLAHALYWGKYRLHRSSSYYFALHHSPAIRQFVETLVARIHFTGQISFDWIDTGTGQPSVIECNPRAISGLHLFSVDDALPAALCGSSEACITPSADAPRMISAVMLTAGLAHAVQNGAVAQWRSDFSAASDVVGIAGDRAPMLGGLVDLGAFMKLSFQRQCTMREAATRDIEWDGEELAPV